MRRPGHYVTVDATATCQQRDCGWRYNPPGTIKFEIMARVVSQHARAHHRQTGHPVRVDKLMRITIGVSVP